MTDYIIQSLPSSPDIGSVSGSGPYFVPFTINYPQSTTTGPLITTSNQPVVVMFTLPYRITVRKVTINVTTLAAASTITAGIYSSDGKTKLIDSGTFDSSSTGVKTNTLGTPVTLGPGSYFFAQSATSGVVNATVLAGDNTRTSLINTNVTRQGTAGNNTSGGVLPSTIGTIGNTGTGFGTLLALFES